ncbi:hypothetical protein [Bradyrhizobium guangdongense]|uniref:hypothetical protein n=1 Tax=Bradyrhizobium guangdongense TaxID=1325090 RepID=UPI0016430F10|nr:hypothetical protein [Bradyrhizobium guangdongense]
MAAIAFNAVPHPQPDSGAFAKQSAMVMSEPKPDFQSLDPDIVSEAIPAFFIGRNRAGFWVARDARGRVGGIFLLKGFAVDFANAQSRPARCALIFPSTPVELDINNHGNPVIAALAQLTALARRFLRFAT